jgi:hypothetical protein
VDGFAGPWQSANEKLEDTSFGIALNALRRAKASWKARHREVKMSAFLVERDRDAYLRQRPNCCAPYKRRYFRALARRARRKQRESKMGKCLLRVYAIRSTMATLDAHVGTKL